MGLRREEGQFVTYDTMGGEEVRVEIEQAPDGFMPVRGDRSLGGLEHLFRPVFLAVGTMIREARTIQPDTVSVRFGIKLTVGGTAVVAKNANEGNFDINLTWSRSDSSSES